MIQLKTDTRLNIVLPNTNKAFAEAIKNATPEQLAVLKEGKDIKSLITSLFKEKIAASKSDQALLQILKNAPAFKNMGSVSERLASFAAELKTLPDLSSKAGKLESFLKNFAALSSGTLKSQIEQSGVFMESKIAHAARLLPSLKETLQQLHTLLSQSSRPEAKTLAGSIEVLLAKPPMQDVSLPPSKSAEIGTALQKIAETLKGLDGSLDPLYSKEVGQIARDIQTLISTSAEEVKPSLSRLYGALLQSTAQETNPILDRIELLLRSDPLPSGELETFSRHLGSVLEKGDPVAKALVHLPKLVELSSPGALDIAALLEKTVGEDLKSQMLGISEELKALPHTKGGELLEQADRLLSAIDYHQLVSYLNASNSIYFPFSWEMLEEGSLAFKKGKEKKFYCEINLRLKEYGELNLMMALHDENRLDIQARTETMELKEQITEHLPQLRAMLIDAGLVLQTVRVLNAGEADSLEHGGYAEDGYAPDTGFEVKV